MPARTRPLFIGRPLWAGISARSPADRAVTAKPASTGNLCPTLVAERVSAIRDLYTLATLHYQGCLCDVGVCLT